MQLLHTIRRKASVCLSQGISPQKLALTLAIGFVVGCIPVVGLPTGICAVIALAFRLNLPAIQAANYMAMPFQVVLIMPLMRLGAKLIPVTTRHSLDFSAFAHSPAAVLGNLPRLILQIGGVAGQALFAWLLLAVPVLVLLTTVLTAVLRRIPVLASAEAGD